MNLGFGIDYYDELFLAFNLPLGSELYVLALNPPKLTLLIEYLFVDK
jgi:hypothetical protein